jgi:nucleotide-binding universal stress UspA family protein
MLPSFPTKKILFPTDFSQFSESAAEHVAGLARATGGKPWLLHIVPCISVWHGASESYFDETGSGPAAQLQGNQAAAEDAARKTLRAFQEKHFGRLTVGACVKSGGVAESIVEYADEIDADLIMMPTRGFGPARRFLIGSVTAKVLHDTPRPTWTTPHVRELEPFHPYRHVVCAVDYRVHCRSVPLRAAASFAQLFNGKLTVVSSIPTHSETESSRKPGEPAQPTKREAILGLRKLLEELEINASIDVLEGSEGEVVRQAAVFEDADLVVIGHGHLDEPMGHLRTHAYEIIWNAPCPVLVV